MIGFITSWITIAVGSLRGADHETDHYQEVASGREEMSASRPMT
jgi:hypothetical protein